MPKFRVTLEIIDDFEHQLEDYVVECDDFFKSQDIAEAMCKTFWMENYGYTPEWIATENITELYEPPAPAAGEPQEATDAD